MALLQGGYYTCDAEWVCASRINCSAVADRGVIAQRNGSGTLFIFSDTLERNSLTVLTNYNF